MFSKPAHFHWALKERTNDGFVQESCLEKKWLLPFSPLEFSTTSQFPCVTSCPTETYHKVCTTESPKEEEYESRKNCTKKRNFSESFHANSMIILLRIIILFFCWGEFGGEHNWWWKFVFCFGNREMKTFLCVCSVHFFLSGSRRVNFCVF